MQGLSIDGGERSLTSGKAGGGGRDSAPTFLGETVSDRRGLGCDRIGVVRKRIGPFPHDVIRKLSHELAC